MRIKLLLLVGLVSLPSYSYSDSIAPYYGTTGNAITDQSLIWSMPDVLPDPAGLDIQNVIYSYRIEKETEDTTTVYVQNENIDGIGYIFRERDDWLPGSLTGTQINKAVPVGDIPRVLWGAGSIEVEGIGSVYEASVMYTYKVTPCFDAQFDPNCPGYTTTIPDIYEFDLDSIYDAMKDENVDLDRSVILEENEEVLDEDEKKKEEEELKRKYRLSKAMSISDTAALFAETQAIELMNSASNRSIITQGYYSASIAGGYYNDTVVLEDTKLPDNKSGLRNGFAQQLLHQQMVDSQYNLKKGE